MKLRTGMNGIARLYQAEFESQEYKEYVKTERSKVSATPRIDTFYGKEPGLAMNGRRNGDSY